MPPTRTYTNSEIVVYWYPELCTHPRHCANILPEVFRPDKRPWVYLDGATAREIILAIDRCPTGALRYSLAEGSSVHPDAAEGPGRQREGQGQGQGTEGQGASPAAPPSGTAAAVKIKVMSDGPLLTEGLVDVVSPDGTVIKRAGRLSLCRCGLSANMPFCDGAHKREGWKPDPE